jgi:hypothetical protein
MVWVIHDVSEADETTHFGETTGMVCGSQFATVSPPLTSAPSPLAHHGTIRHFVAFFGTAEFVDQLQLGVTRGNHQLALSAIHYELQRCSASG